MVLIVIIIVVAIFLAANMGVSGFSVSFAPSYGSGILRKRAAVLLYTVGVVLGGVLFGPRVAETLVHKIAINAHSSISPLLVVITCAFVMFVSNLLKVPQSTSFIAVSGFTGAGLYWGSVNWPIIGKILWVALLFAALAFWLVWGLKRFVYPPRQNNLIFYEFFLSERQKVRKFIVAHDLYAAFSVGTNNVANVVAPLLLISSIQSDHLFWIIGPFFGIGALLAGERAVKALSKDIIPVGEISASMVSMVTATFVLIASYLGLPTPYAQITTFAVLGVSCAKDGFRRTFSKEFVRRILWVWLIGPVITTGLSYLLHVVFIRSHG